MNQACGCCGAPVSAALKTPRLSLYRCSQCGTFWAEHIAPSRGAEPWVSDTITADFLQTLRARRLLQSEIIIRRFHEILQKGRILDYGCGQGIFVNALAAHGYDAAGCDTSSSVAGAIDPGRFIQLNEPWGMPEPFNFKTVALLDVLEHHPNPADLIQRFSDLGAKYLIVKIPLAMGPLYKLARMMTTLGRSSLMEKLYLAGEAAPHTIYFTSQGLSRLCERAGFGLLSSLRMAEVGRDLPSRMRKNRSGPLTVKGLSAAGYLAEFLSPLWPDTSVFLFGRTS